MGQAGDQAQMGGGTKEDGNAGKARKSDGGKLKQGREQDLDLKEGEAGQKVKEENAEIYHFECTLGPSCKVCDTH